MRKEAQDQTIAEMQKSIYLHRERNIDEVIASNIIKHSHYHNPVCVSLLFSTVVGKQPIGV